MQPALSGCFGKMAQKNRSKYRVPIILAFVAFSFYVASIVMQVINSGAS